MSTPIYHDSDADLSIVENKRLAFIGYGNQGAAQAKNLRDSGVRAIVIGNLDDAYKDAASADGFRVASIAEAAAWVTLYSYSCPTSTSPSFSVNSPFAQEENC